MSRAYGVVFSAIGVLALTAGLSRGLGPALLLIWPVASLLVVGYAYLRGDVRVFGKQADGTRAAAASILLFSYLCLVELVWRAASAVSREPAFAQLGEGLWIARRLRLRELPAGVEWVVDLTCEFVEPAKRLEPRGYLSFPMLDGAAPSYARLRAAVEQVATVECVLIHCAQGHGRTGLFAAALMLRRGLARTPEQALAQIIAARPKVRLSSAQIRALHEYADKLGVNPGQ